MNEVITIAGTRLKSDNVGDVIMTDDDEGYLFIRNDEIPGIIVFLLSVEVRTNNMQETAEQEIERLHKQDGKGDAPRYFSLSEAGIE